MLTKGIKMSKEMMDDARGSLNLSEPAKLLWDPKDFKIGFRVSTEMMKDCNFTLSMLEDRIRECRESLASQLFNDTYGTGKEEKHPSKLRQWLGWKLWSWAVSLNPDCYND